VVGSVGRPACQRSRTNSQPNYYYIPLPIPEQHNNYSNSGERGQSSSDCKQKVRYKCQMLSCKINADKVSDCREPSDHMVCVQRRRFARCTRLKRGSDVAANCTSLAYDSELLIEPQPVSANMRLRNCAQEIAADPACVSATRRRSTSMSGLD
jgi:hypothetical protein